MCLRLSALTMFLAMFAVSARALEVDVTGDVTNRNGAARGSFQGTLDIIGFEFDQGQLVAHAFLKGKVRNEEGEITNRLAGRAVTLQVIAINATDDGETCQVLDLTLERVDVKAQLRVIHLERAVVDISAHPNSEPLGDILCDVADGLGLQLSDVLEDLQNTFHTLKLAGERDTFRNLLNEIVEAI